MRWPWRKKGMPVVTLWEPFAVYMDNRRVEVVITEVEHDSRLGYSFAGVDVKRFRNG